MNVGRATEALTLQKPLVVASLSILAHGSMPWESRTMVAVAVQGAPGNCKITVTGPFTSSASSGTT